MNWKGKKVLVTGAGGFIGSHLVERLLLSGADVRSFVHYNALGNCGWLDQICDSNSHQIVSGDICDRDRVSSAMDEIDIVFHLAALIGIPYSYYAPVSYVRTNVEGTLNVLLSAKEHGVDRVIHTSTSEVYGTAKYVPIDENHPLQGQSPYSASKIGADKMVESFFCSFNLPVVTIRPFNTFGPRQSTRAIIPTIISQCLISDTIHLGSLTPTRDLNYVSNTVDGFIHGAETDKAIGKVINVGSGSEISIHDLVLKIAGKMDKNMTVVSDEMRIRPEMSEVERLLADNSCARDILGWSPAVSLDEGLEKTIDWFTHRAGSIKKGYTI